MFGLSGDDANNNLPEYPVVEADFEIIVYPFGWEWVDRQHAYSNNRVPAYGNSGYIVAGGGGSSNRDYNPMSIGNYHSRHRNNEYDHHVFNFTSLAGTVYGGFGGVAKGISSGKFVVSNTGKILSGSKYVQPMSSLALKNKAMYEKLFKLGIRSGLLIGVGFGVLEICTAPNPRAQWQASWGTMGSLSGGIAGGVLINFVPGAQVWSTWLAASAGSVGFGYFGNWSGGVAYDRIYGD